MEEWLWLCMIKFDFLYISVLIIQEIFVNKTSSKHNLFYQAV